MVEPVAAAVVAAIKVVVIVVVVVEVVGILLVIQLYSRKRHQYELGDRLSEQVMFGVLRFIACGRFRASSSGQIISQK